MHMYLVKHIRVCVSVCIIRMWLSQKFHKAVSNDGRCPLFLVAFHFFKVLIVTHFYQPLLISPLTLIQNPPCANYCSKTV